MGGFRAALRVITTTREVGGRTSFSAGQESPFPVSQQRLKSALSKLAKVPFRLAIYRAPVHISAQSNTHGLL
jgi:hypothetical protein